MARPPGEIRSAVLDVIRSGPCTLVDIVQRANVGYDAARYTVQNAVRGGAVHVCGHEKRPHAKRWLAIYEVAEEPEQHGLHVVGGDGFNVEFEQLGSAMRAWSFGSDQ